MLRLVLIAALAAASPGAAAQLNKCVGAGGKTIYQDGPCPTGSKPARIERQATPPSSTPAAPAPAGSSATSAPEESVTMDYYDIDGASRNELLASMFARKKKEFVGYAQWRVPYTYDTAQAPGRCAVARVRSRMEGVITMPRWTRRGAAPADVVAHWTRFESALLAHEQGHLDHGREYARRIQAELMRLSAPDCAALAGAAKRLEDSLMNEFRAKDKDYDARTDHGRNQGANF